MEPALLPRECVWWKTGIRLPWVMWMSAKIKRCHRCATYPKWRSSCQHIYCQEHNDQKSKFPELQACITSLKSQVFTLFAGRFAIGNYYQGRSHFKPNNFDSILSVHFLFQRISVSYCHFLSCKNTRWSYYNQLLLCITYWKRSDKVELSGNHVLYKYLTLAKC